MKIGDELHVAQTGDWPTDAEIAAAVERWTFWRGLQFGKPTRWKTPKGSNLRIVTVKVTGFVPKTPGAALGVCDPELPRYLPRDVQAK
jgi:hypothetical protein